MVGVTSAGVIDTAAYSCTSCTGILGKQESLEAAAACFPATLPPAAATTASASVASTTPFSVAALHLTTAVQRCTSISSQSCRRFPSAALVTKEK